VPARRVTVDEEKVSNIPHLELVGDMPVAAEVSICGTVESPLAAGAL